MALYDDWRDQVYQKLSDAFGSDAETFARIMFYLDAEEKAYENQSKISPVWRTMKNSMHSEAMFRNYSKRLADDTKTAEKDVEFRRTMNQMYDQMLVVSENKSDVSVYQNFNMKKFADLTLAQRSGLIGFARAWTVIPLSAQNSILSFIRNIPNRVLVGQVDEVVGLFNKAGGSVVMVGLAFVTLSYDAIVSIHRWWKGEITGVRCCKLIVDSALTTAACVAGSVGGAAIGSLAGPIGTLIGGVAGGVASAQTINYLSDRLTQWIFGIPKEEALENAYNYFGIKMNASNHEINTAFRKLCLKHHPDKGGNSNDFHIVQVNMAVIKAAKGDL